MLGWIHDSFDFPLLGILQNKQWDRLHKNAKQFGDASDGVLGGVFGAIDGWAVKIIAPTGTQVPDPGNYFCRKGF